MGGRYLAHMRATAAQRALVAADISLGHIQVERLTLRQAASLAGVSVAYAAAARRVVVEQPHKRAAVAVGSASLTKVARTGHRPRVERFREMYFAMTEPERIAAVKLIGPDLMFNVAVEAA
jgi:hypothetical protein